MHWELLLGGCHSRKPTTRTDLRSMMRCCQRCNGPRQGQHVTCLRPVIQRRSLNDSPQALQPRSMYEAWMMYFCNAQLHNLIGSVPDSKADLQPPKLRTTSSVAPEIDRCSYHSTRIYSFEVGNATGGIVYFFYLSPKSSSSQVPPLPRMSGRHLPSRIRHIVFVMPRRNNRRT